MACVTACPSGRAVRPADRGDPGPGRAPASTGPPPSGRCARRSSRSSPTRAGCGCCAGRCGSYQAHRAVRGVLRTQRCCCTGSRRRSRAMEALAPPLGAARPLPERTPAPGPRRRHRRHARRLRAARVLPRRQRGHRPGARGRGLRRRRPAPAGLLRRAVGAQRARGRGAARSPGALIDDLRARRRRRVVVNAAGCGSSMKEYAELLARRPGVRRAGARRSRPRSATSPSCWPSSGPVGAAAPAAGDGRLPRRLPPRRTPRASAASPASCCAASPGSSCARSPRPSSAAARRASTTCSNPEPAARARATARPRNVLAHRRRAAGHRQPRLPDAGRAALAAALRRRGWRSPTPSRCSTPRSVGSGVGHLGVRAPHGETVPAPDPSRSTVRHAHFNDEVNAMYRPGPGPGWRTRWR